MTEPSVHLPANKPEGKRIALTMLAAFEINRLYAVFFLTCLNHFALSFCGIERELSPAVWVLIKCLLAVVLTGSVVLEEKAVK